MAGNPVFPITFCCRASHPIVFLITTLSYVLRRLEPVIKQMKGREEMSSFYSAGLIVLVKAKVLRGILFVLRTSWIRL